ncbi:hypothetical protein AHAS_Ahas01G0186900 [Arachis hypogaea]
MLYFDRGCWSIYGLSDVTLEWTYLLGSQWRAALKPVTCVPCCYCVITKTKCKAVLKFLKLSILLGRSKGAGSYSQIFSGSSGWMRDLRIQNSPWFVGPPIALPAGPWVMCRMCPLSRVCIAWMIMRSISFWKCLHFNKHGCLPLSVIFP